MKSVVRVICEIIAQGDSQMILDNTELFFDMEKSHLELAFANGNMLNKDADKYSFTDYYIKTYLKEFLDAFTQQKENEVNEIPCNINIRGEK